MTQVFIVNADGSGLRRLSNSNGIDTEAAFSADGQLAFTSPATAAAARRSTR
jgi:TolB protein